MSSIDVRESATFEEECSATLSRLRAALIELYDAAGADTAAPQDVSRRYRLNKTLTWSITRLLQEPDNLAAVAYVPGTTSIEKLSKALDADDTGAGERVRDAAYAFDRMVKVHVTDRATLDLMIDSMSPGGGDGLELSRRLAFRGNSGICGVQARTRLMCWFMAPNTEDDARVDMAMVSGYVGLRRLRPSVEWPLFKLRHWSDAQEDVVVTQRWQPVDPEAPFDNGLHLIPTFSRGRLPSVREVESGEGIDYVLERGPVGNVGAFDCFRAEMLRAAADRYRADGDETGEFGATITTPSETLVFDLIIHEDLAFALDPEVLVFGRQFKHGERTGSRNDPSLLPIRQQPVALAGSPPAVATAQIPRYAELVRFVGDRLGFDLSRFRGTRLELKYPPLHSTVLLRFDLPAPPR